MAGECAITVKYFVRDESDNDRLAVSLSEEGEWESVVNSPRLRMIGFELEPDDATARQIDETWESGGQRGSKYVRGVWKIPVAVENETLRACI